jgi:hypothetical protein
MMEEIGIAILLLLAARGYFACASDLGQIMRKHYQESPEPIEHVEAGE